jgi:hypothetical protein
VIYISHSSGSDKKGKWKKMIIRRTISIFKYACVQLDTKQFQEELDDIESPSSIPCNSFWTLHRNGVIVAKNFLIAISLVFCYSSYNNRHLMYANVIRKNNT